MNYSLLIDNLTNPVLLFFILGVLAVRLKSDLEIPSNSSKFISLYLLFSIGFKGGQELAHSQFTLEIVFPGNSKSNFQWTYGGNNGLDGSTCHHYWRYSDSLIQ
jgi:hypothetical protein